jgi:hypothetical protein
MKIIKFDNNRDHKHVLYCVVRPESRNSGLNSQKSFPRQRTEAFPLQRHRQTIILIATTEVFS